MKIYNDIESERDRIEASIRKYGWTSDHNLDWFSVSVVNGTGKPAFAEFEDGSGILVHFYPEEWHVWSDPLCGKDLAVGKIAEFTRLAFKEGLNKVLCNDASNDIRIGLLRRGDISVGEIDYSLDWPVLNMREYDPSLSGNHFKEIRNARNKIYKEHNADVLNSSELDKKTLHEIIDAWQKTVDRKDNYNYRKYHNAIENNFRGFLTARVLRIDGRAVGINAGYEVINRFGRFAGVIGIHDYSFKDLGLILWLEDLEWVKNNGYKEMDMQGDEGGGLKFKMQFNPIIERKTNTFSISNKINS